MTITRRPFIGSEAVADGSVRKHQLRSRFRSVFPDVYVPVGYHVTAKDKAVAAWLWSHRQGVVAGLSASALHGSKWIDDDLPAELIWPNTRPPRGLRAYDIKLRADEIGSLTIVPATTPERTALDIGRRGPVDDAVARIDALVQATGVTVSAIADLAESHRGARGLRQLETVLDLVDPGAESPKETWLRLVLIRAGLPRPTTQIPVFSPYSGKAYYLDMGWQELKVAVEYDGEHHRTSRGQYRKDHRRREELEHLGWLVIRVIVGDHPADIIGRVRAARESRESSLYSDRISGRKHALSTGSALRG